MNRTEPGLHFALGRLLTKSADSKTAWLEANLAGTLVHLVVYLFAFQLLLAHRPLSTQLLLLIPLAFLICISWVGFFYLSSLLIRGLVRLGLMRNLSRLDRQSILVGLVTTGFALALIRGGSWMSLVGFIWIGAVTLNLIATALLSLRPSDGSAGE